MVTKTKVTKAADPDVPEAVAVEDISEPAPAEETAPKAGTAAKAFGNGSKAMEWLMLVPTPVMVVDREMNVTFMNQAGAGAVGKTPKACLEQKCYDLFKTGDCNTANCAVAKAMQNDGVFTSETVAKLPSGELPIRYTGAPVKDNKGNIIGALEYVVDITAIKKEMADAQQKIGYLNDIPTPIMTIDKDFTITYMNPAGAGVAGKTVEQVMGTKCYDLFKTSHCHTAECRCGQAMSKGVIATGETVVDPQGLNIPIMYTGAPIKDADGKIIGALEYVVNITGTKKAMDDAQQKVDYLNKIPTPVMAVDKEMNVLFMNPAGAGAVGKTPEACLGKKCASLFNTGHCNTADCAVAKAIQQDGIFTNDTVAKLPSGELPIRYTDAPLKDERGNIVGGLEYVVDITKEVGVTTGVGDLVAAAVEGNLAARTEEQKFEGNYQQIVKNVNNLLDAVVEPINESAGVLAKLAANDLTAKVMGDYKGDLAKIKNAVNTVVDSLSQLVTQIKNNADGLAASSEQLSKASDQAGQATQQIASTSQQVAKKASDQSSALQQTTDGMEQLSKAVEQISGGAQDQAKSVEKTVAAVNQVSASVSQVSDNAQVAAEGARSASESAQKGAEMAGQTVDGMEKIRETMGTASGRVTELGDRSNEIGKIVATIDDIAAQTNLLALNAAIEAARAGEQGRGFAVVADEVRKLAERSSTATKEIADLITGIQKGVAEAVKAMEDGNKEVDAGYKQATDAGESLGDILKTVQEVGSQVEKIAGASEELGTLSTEMVKLTDSVSSVVEENTAATEQMSANSNQVSKSIENVAGVAEENSAATEQVSASAQEMSAQVQQVVASAKSLKDMSDELMKNVAVFKLDGAKAETTEAKVAKHKN